MFSQAPEVTIYLVSHALLSPISPYNSALAKADTKTICNFPNSALLADRWPTRLVEVLLIIHSRLVPVP
jgi:hypothetical protein